MKHDPTLDIAKIRERADKATEGPWQWDNEKYKSQLGETAPSLVAGGAHGVLSCDGPLNGPNSNDAAFIAHARTDLPAALDLLEEARDIYEALVEGLGCGNYENDTGAKCADNHDDLNQWCPNCRARAWLERVGKGK